MGGYGSTRWNFEHTRQDTGGLLRLDVPSLKRAGALQPGTVSTSSWTRADGELAGSIVIRMVHDGRRLTLDYSTRATLETDWTRRTLHIWLEWTPCHFGGERVWFRCPHCQSRRAVLYSSGGVFSCRACHDLAYTSTRLDDMERAYRTIRKLQQRLGAPANVTPWHIPERPSRMHWTTYERLSWQLYTAIMEREAMFSTRAAKLVGSVDQLLSQRQHLRP